MDAQANPGRVCWNCSCVRACRSAASRAPGHAPASQGRGHAGARRACSAATGSVQRGRPMLDFIFLVPLRAIRMMSHERMLVAGRFSAAVAAMRSKENGEQCFCSKVRQLFGFHASTPTIAASGYRGSIYLEAKRRQ